MACISARLMSLHDLLGEWIEKLKDKANSVQRIYTAPPLRSFGIEGEQMAAWARNLIGKKLSDKTDANVSDLSLHTQYSSISLLPSGSLRIP